MKTFQIALCAAVIAVASFAAVHQVRHSSQPGPIVVADDPYPGAPPFPLAK
ncbi:MAG TPA: hypothetical protein VG096_19010 [Bryobacteraceae bacterium]|jgi:hypothetical protein|nr:hypothetical protein [Bryobacteraceae bacterium]